MTRGEATRLLASLRSAIFIKIQSTNKLINFSKGVNIFLAGSRFKIAQSWSAAGEMYEKAATIQLEKLQNRHEAAQNLVEAGNCWRKAEPKRASHCLLRAIEVYIDLGRVNLVAKQHVTLGEIWEAEAEMAESAIEHFTKAAQIFRGEEQQSQVGVNELRRN